MADFEKAFAALQKCGNKITYRRGTIPRRTVQKELRPAFARLCAAYAGTTLVQRVDTYIFFEGRDNLLEELSLFAADRAQQASKEQKADKKDAARASTEQAVAADLIVDGRAQPNLIDEAQKQIHNAVAETGFELGQYVLKLDLNAASFAKAAVQLEKQGEKLDAIHALGVALQMKPELARHPNAIDLAVRLTDKRPEEAIALVQDRFERGLFIDQEVRLNDRKALRRKQQSPEANFWPVTIAGTIFLAVLPPIAFPFVFGQATDPSGVPSGLIVGTVTSVVYLMNRLRERKRFSG